MRTFHVRFNFFPDAQTGICPNAQAQPDPSSCEHFYECVGSTPFLKSCAPGTRFDVSLGICNYAHLVTCHITDATEITSTLVSDPSGHRSIQTIFN